MIKFFHEFSDSLALSIIIIPIIGFVFLVPIFYHQYMKYRKINTRTVIFTYLILVYFVATFVAFTLFPFPQNPAQYCMDGGAKPNFELDLIIDTFLYPSTTMTFQLVMNIIFFVPLGIFLKNFFRIKIPICIVIGIVASTIIELTQLTGVWGIFPCAYRIFDVDDILLNSIGCAIGAILGIFLPNLKTEDKGREFTNKPSVIRSFTIFMVDLFISYTISTLILVFLKFTFHLSFRFVDLLIFLGITNQDAKDLNIIYIVHIFIFLLLFFFVPIKTKGSTIAGYFSGTGLNSVKRSPFKANMFYFIRFVCLSILVFSPVIIKVPLIILSTCYYLIKKQSIWSTLVS